MTEIHPTAVVEPGAELGERCRIGAYALVFAGARLGDDCVIGPRATIHGRVTLGARCTVDTGAILGGAAQDLKCTTDETFLELGDDNSIRENVTVHRSNHEGGVTRVGSGCLLMGFVHLGHDCQVGDHVMLANLVTIGGHCHLGDRVVIGGMTAVHQKVSIGRMAMVSGLAGVNTDVPPFALAEGNPNKVRGINVVGLRRNGVTSEARAALQRAIRLLYLSHGHRGQMLEQLRAEPSPPAELVELLDFVAAIREGKNGRQLER